MYGFLTKLLVSGKLKFSEGEIDFTGQPMTFMPLRTLKFMTDDAIKKGPQALNELYLYGWHFGFFFTYHYMKTFTLKKFEETYKLIMDVAALIGYGDYKTLEFKHKVGSKYHNIMNPFGLMYYPSKQRVCHFIRGVNGGGGAALHETMMQSVEFECAANNKKFCSFANVADKILISDKKYKQLVKEQLDLKWLRPRQLEIIKEVAGSTKPYLI